MFKLSAIILAASVVSANAMDISNQPVSNNVEVAQATGIVANDATATETNIVPPALLEQFKAVCASKAKKSKALTKACETNTPPAVTKKGDRFKAAKGGAEVNILYSNIEFFK